MALQSFTGLSAGSSLKTNKLVGLVSLSNGGTGSNLSATGGAGYYLKQSTIGAAVTVGMIQVTDLPTVIVAGGPVGGASVIPIITWNAAGQLTTVSSANVTIPTSSSPTALVGLTAITGTASTFMTSDSSPALDQSIAPIWTGLHTFSQAPAAPFTSKYLAAVATIGFMIA